jgi:hypothetical protein
MIPHLSKTIVDRGDLVIRVRLLTTTAMYQFGVVGKFVPGCFIHAKRH